MSSTIKVGRSCEICWERYDTYKLRIRPWERVSTIACMSYNFSWKLPPNCRPKTMSSRNALRAISENEEACVDCYRDRTVLPKFLAH
mmetsp:Transcript_7834/g.19196  ORF Transcript_7834/g.19196 Transcript_7834/m.19196 type:complete len:87 (+) Transcript_7834:572-832(+)